MLPSCGQGQWTRQSMSNPVVPAEGMHTLHCAEPDYLATHNISLQSTTPYEKGSTSTSENAIRLVKRALTKVCLYEPKNWAQYCELLVNGINSSILYNGTSRTQLYFGPTHFKNVYSVMCSVLR